MTGYDQTRIELDWRLTITLEKIQSETIAGIVKTTEPLVSILMNCYNGEKYLREAIDSVLTQTFKNWELIFWDNRSTDRSAEIFHSYRDPRLRYFLAPEHTDLGGGRAQAWRHLNGDLIGVLDADDIWLPRKLEEQLKYFQDIDVGICITNVEVFSEKRKEILFSARVPEGRVTNQLLKQYYVSLSSIILRRSSIERLDYAFDKEFSYICDFDLIVRLSVVVKLAYVSKVLAKNPHSQGYSNFGK